METKYTFLTYNIWTDNDVHMGHSINIDGLTYEDVVEAIERQQWIKEHEIKLSNEDLLEIENLKDYTKRLKESNKEFTDVTCKVEYMGEMPKTIKAKPELVYIRNFITEVKKEFPDIIFTYEYNEDFDTWEIMYLCKAENFANKIRLGRLIKEMLLGKNVYNFNLSSINEITI